MTDENMRQKFRKKNIDERRNYFSEKINQNNLMSKKHKKVYTVLNDTEHQLTLIYTVNGCVSISAFAFTGIQREITSLAIELKLCVINPGIKKYKPIIKKENKKHDKIVLLAKSILNSAKVFSSKALIHEFLLTNDVLKKILSYEGRNLMIKVNEK